MLIKITTTAAPALALFILGLSAGGESPKKDYPVRPVDFTKVSLKDEFWTTRMEMNRSVTIPFAFQKNEETGRVDNFRKAAGLMKGPFTGKRYNDSDVYKAMEGAAYSLLLHPDPVIKKKLDDLIGIIGKAQEPDGYLFTARTVDPKNPAPGAGKERWSNLRVSHELYCAGHMYEAAVAHYLATSQRTFLDIALKNAGLLLNTFGPGKKRGFPGHQEVEIGLAKLYRATGDQRYLDLAKFFLDERGRYHGGETYPPNSPFAVYNNEEYLQNHKPVLDQAEAVGHAVRAAYMYAGMADIAALGGYPEYAAAIDRLWENVVGKKMYLTGGIGSREGTEGFGDAYVLPNRKAYAETCASIGNALWNYRLFLLHGDGKYIDVFERILYNGLISGVSLSGDLFFYQNPLESGGDYGRSPWFEVACCPANLARFLPSLPGYVYAVGDDTLYINLFVANEAKMSVNGKDVYFIQESKYPWEGGVTIGVNPVGVNIFTLALRIPGWARNEPVPGDLYRFLDKNDQAVRLKVNGKAAEVKIDRGYARIRRKWRKGDVVEMRLPMPIRRVVAGDLVKDDEGKVALQRGPIVFCAEGLDNAGRALNLLVPDDARLQSWYRRDFLGGSTVITGQVLAVQNAPSGKPEVKKQGFFALPYCLWAYRGKGEMAVWFPRKAAK
jgi:DUF1680 family protein